MIRLLYVILVLLPMVALAMTNPTGGVGGAIKSEKDDPLPPSSSAASSSRTPHAPPALLALPVNRNPSNTQEYLRYEAQSPFVLNLPTRAPHSFTVPAANEPIAAFDFSLPPEFRTPRSPVDISTFDDATLADCQNHLRHYHRTVLAQQHVVRPMEVDFPPLTLNPTEEHFALIHRAQSSLAHNAWLLSGPQAAMLKNAQAKIRGLSLFPIYNIYHDHPENAVLRSVLDRLLKDPTRFRVSDFPQAMRAAIVETRYEQKLAQDPIHGKGWGEEKWLEAFPFLENRDIDVAYWLLNH